MSDSRTVPVTSVAITVHSCHFWLKCQVNSVVNNQSTRLDADSSQNHGTVCTVSAVCARSDITHCSTQCCSQAKGDVREEISQKIKSAIRLVIRVTTMRNQRKVSMSLKDKSARKFNRFPAQLDFQSPHQTQPLRHSPPLPPHLEDE
eukprot:5907966-Amphidinium_carterae.1